MADTPAYGTPALGAAINVCPAHSGMVTRDHFELAIEAIHGQIAAERRRIDTVCGPDGSNGKLDSLKKRIDELSAWRQDVAKAEMDRLKSINGAAWKLLAAALGGGSLIPLLERLL